MRKILFPVIVFISLHGAAQTRKYSNEFLNIGIGGRALGMGNAAVASEEGVYCGYWNPAGLLKQKNDLEVGLMHSEYFAGIAKFDYLAASRRIDSNSVAGISLIRFGVDNIPNTLDLVDANGNVDYNRIKTFNVVDFAALLSYARTLPALKGVELGGSFKIIRRRIGEFAGAWGFGLDAGARYNYKGWRFAAMARDVTGTYNAWSYTLDQKQIATLVQTGNQIPSNSLEVTTPRLILGVSKGFKVWKDQLSILGELDLISTFDGQRNTVFKTELWSGEPAFGVEVGYKGFVFLRGGIGNIQKQLNDRATIYVTTAQPNVGVGVHYRIFTLDYALSMIGDRSGGLYSNIFTLKVDLNNKVAN